MFKSSFFIFLKNIVYLFIGLVAGNLEIWEVLEIVGGTAII